MTEIISKSLEETKKLAAEWVGDITLHPSRSVTVGSLPSREVVEAVVVGLSGHLGSGKTTFVQAVAEALGVKEFITSPTFVIMKMYPVNNAKFPRCKKLIHIDAYRLESGKELEVLDFEKLVSDPGNMILIEWPENVRTGLPENASRIEFEAVGANERKITFE